MSKSMSQILEDVLDESTSTVFPVRQETFGKNPTAMNVWHQAPSDEQVAGRLSRGMKTEDAHDLLACGAWRFSLASMPQRFMKGRTPKVCEFCVENGDLSYDDVVAEAEKLIAETLRRFRSH